MKEFHLRWEIPLDSLIPPIPSRLDYILHIQDLLSISRQESSKIWGIDIGTGASCIYPLLGCTINPEWHFLGVEIKESSLEFAKSNIERNNLSDRIILKLNQDPGKVLSKDLIDIPGVKKAKYDFLMCNPPFYEDLAQISMQASFKQKPPHAACTGSKNEMITNGGEVHFLSELIRKSFKLRRQVHWFTCLIGRKQDALYLQGITL